MKPIEIVLEENTRVRQCAHAEACATATAFGLELPLTVEPVEVTPAPWVEKRRSEEQRRGVGLWKFFALAGA